MGAVRLGATALSGVLWTAVVISAGGCQNSPSDEPAVRKGTVADLNRCVHKPNEGGEAIFSLSTERQIVDSGFFGKAMNAPDLKAVLGASAQSTIQYAKTIGLNLFKTPYIDGESICPTFESLDFAPAKLQKVWDVTSSGIKGKGTLLGVYFDYTCLGSEVKSGLGAPRCSDSRVVEPTILVTEATDKWTLVHEMMHHNFKKTAKESGAVKPDHVLIDELSSAALEFEAAAKEYQAAKNRARFGDWLKALQRLIPVLVATMPRGKLEETAIEGLLVELWTSNQLDYVTTTGSSVWYMKEGAKDADEMVGAVKEQIEAMRKEAREQNWPDSAGLATDIKAMTDLADQFLEKIRTTVAAASYKLGNLGIRTPKGDDFLIGLRAEMRDSHGAASMRPERAFENHLDTHTNPELEAAKDRVIKILSQSNR